MQQLPQHQPVPPVFGVADRQDMIQEVVDKTTELVGWCRRHGCVRVRGIQATAMSMQNRFDVKLLLVAEVVVDRRDVGPGPVSDRADARRLVTLAGEFLTGRLDQTILCRV